VQSIARALRVLEALAASRGEIGIVELSRRVALHVSTVHRLLATLADEDYVRQNPDSGGYGLGHKTFQLAEAYIGQIDLRQAVRPILERLSQETGETANLVIRDGREALYLDKAESPRSLRIFSRIGRRAPLHCTAVGKVLLASAPQAGVEALLGDPPFERLTRRTITSATQLRRELAGVRVQGFAVDREECEEGACCLAAPVRNVTGETVAAVGISGPAVRMTPRRIQELIPVIVRAGREMSERLGCREHAPTDTLAVAHIAGNQRGR
jgi:DNA-binding IclR family transcriptional regulator